MSAGVPAEGQKALRLEEASPNTGSAGAHTAHVCVWHGFAAQAEMYRVTHSAIFN